MDIPISRGSPVKGSLDDVPVSPRQAPSRDNTPIDIGATFDTTALKHCSEVRILAVDNAKWCPAAQD